MKISILTFDGFNEIDSFVALNVLNRVKADDWDVKVACFSEKAVSMNGVEVFQQETFEDATYSDAVIVGSGRNTKEHIGNAELMSSIRLSSDEQLICSQCSGVLILDELNILKEQEVCTDAVTRPALQKEGYRVLEQPFHAQDNIAMAGGCLGGQYLAGWLIASLLNEQVAKDALRCVAPVGEEDIYVERAFNNIRDYIYDVRSLPRNNVIDIQPE